MRTRPVLFLLCFAAACGGNDAIDVGPRGDLNAATALSARRACQFKAGDIPGLTLQSAAPLGPQIPIDTIVILMFENRSFDHLLGNLKSFGQPDADVAPEGVTNPDTMGMPAFRYHDTDYCFTDTNHEWKGSHDEYDDGKNDGFVIANATEGGATDGGRRAMSYYTEDDVPTIYTLARDYAVADRYFCSLLGPTFPNREYLYAATSLSNTDNQIIAQKKTTLMESLEVGGVSWRIYDESIPGYGVFLGNATSYFGSRIGSAADFFTAAQAGTLEHVVFLDPDLRNEWGGGDDFHPPGDVQVGDAYLAKVVDALQKSPQWPHLALFVTFDENGGLYDHVAPPLACPPDGLFPDAAEPAGARFDRYGFRVPAIVVSPYARPHAVSHAIYDHSSIVRFVETRFHLLALTARDANADPMLDLFDFGQPALLSPPPLPPLKMDMKKLQACQTRFPIKPAGM